MPSLLTGLLGYLQDKLPEDHSFAGIHARPLPSVPPDVWMLGTSGKSARYAAQFGTAFAFGHFMSEEDGPAIVRSYRESFQPSVMQGNPAVIVALSVMCGDRVRSKTTGSTAFAPHAYSRRHAAAYKRKASRTTGGISGRRMDGCNDSTRLRSPPALL